MSQHLRPQLLAIWYCRPTLPLSAACPAASPVDYSTVAGLLPAPPGSPPPPLCLWAALSLCSFLSPSLEISVCLSASDGTNNLLVKLPDSPGGLSPSSDFHSPWVSPQNLSKQSSLTPWSWPGLYLDNLLRVKRPESVGSLLLGLSSTQKMALDS